MPNWVKNIVCMKGIAQEPLFTEEGGVKKFDFNTLIRMPPSLNIESGSMTDENIIYYLTERCTIPLDKLSEDKKELLNKLVRNILGGEKWHETVFLRVMSHAFDESEEKKTKRYTDGGVYVANYQRYGAPTWYNWCCENWGTKWNACRTNTVDDNTISFNTAWGTPLPVIARLAETYPNRKIEHWWADEDVGRNDGYAKYIGGIREVCIHYDEYSKGACATYIRCWGESRCLYKDEDGEWHKHDCDDCGLRRHHRPTLLVEGI